MFVSCFPSFPAVSQAGMFFLKHVATYASDQVMVHAKDVKPFGQLKGGDLCPDFVNRTVGPFLRGTSHLYYMYYLSGVDWIHVVKFVGCCFAT